MSVEPLGVHNVFDRIDQGLAEYLPLRRSHNATVVGLVLGLWGLGAAVAQAPVQTSYVVTNWLPSPVALKSKANSTSKGPLQSVAPLQVLPSDAMLCLVPGAKVSQTLVQVQPKEGGEARFVVLGGRKPICAEIGAAWRNASTSDGPWYQSLFSVFRSDKTTVRVSASTAGATRDPNDGDTRTEHSDPCGIFPAKAGSVLLAAGRYRLTLGTTLPDGQVLRWTLVGKESTGATEVATQDGRIEVPELSYVAGQRWRLVHVDHSGENQAKGCNVTAAVLPPQASPLGALRAHAPLVGASSELAHATLVANLLSDDAQAEWHAWLLGTLHPRRGGRSDEISVQLWTHWWLRSTSQPTPTSLPH